MKAKIVGDFLVEKGHTTPMIKKTKLKLSKNKRDKKLSDNELDDITTTYMKESVEDKSLKSILSQIRELENDVTDVSQAFEWDNPAGYFAEVLKRPEIADMSKGQIQRDKNLMRQLRQYFDNENMQIAHKIQTLQNKVFKMYPLLKELHNREVVPYDDTILDAQDVYKNGKTWTIVTPRYYNDDCDLSKEEVAELKKFIRDKGIKKQKKTYKEFGSYYD